ncbi:MAG: cobalamin B12-binding domain-containing protein [Candidatus Jordarchaeum sp.]|uniref:cobalamin B12-binding domain-containing protein n=1 Tax=Candidatus Jordarchaeum sp. TaxID=2823881 RepID=UPI00404B8A40
MGEKEKEILQRLSNSIINLDIEGVKQACEDALAQGIPPIKAVTEGMAQGMDIVGQKYENQEYYLAELVMAGEVMKEGMKVLEPYLKDAEVKRLGKVVVGTVQGDLHDIGKNIFATLLEASGFDVVDLGANVSTNKFVEVVRDQKPKILGLSALLTITMVELGNVVKELENADLRNQVKVIVGGAPLTEDYAKKIGADAYAPDAVAGVNICKKWVE